MKHNSQIFIHRAGITTMNVLLIIGAVVIGGSLIWSAIAYFTGPKNENVRILKNINGNISVVTERRSTQRTIRGFFSRIASDWRPAKQAFAMENGQTIEKYEYNLDPGPIELPVFDNQEVEEPIDEPVTNTNSPIVDTNGNANANANVSDTTNNDNSNSSLPVTNENTNTIPVISNGNENTNQTVISNENTNTTEPQVNANLNTNSPPINTNQPTSQNTNQPTTQNINQPLPSNTNTPPVANENTNTTGTVNDNGNTNTAPANANTSQNDEPPSEVLTPDEWRKRVPRGHGFFQANWFCSAALTKLSLVLSDGTAVPLGDFTGDCTNPNVVVKGSFLPQQLPDIDLTQPLNFRLVSELYAGPVTSETATNLELCTIDYIRGAGYRDVYAMQYTCDEGMRIGVRDDIQFTVYAFPSSWTFPKNREDLFTADDLKRDDDGDGLNLRRELKLGTNPNHWDSDSDNLGDYEEVEKYETNPLQADTDNDGYKDYVEINGGYNPLGSGQATAEQLAAWAQAPNQPGKPTITNVAATYSGGQVTVSWNVSPSADGIVTYGPDDSYGTYRNNTAFIQQHAILIPAVPGQTLHYAIRSCTPAPNAACTTTNDATIDIPAE